MEVLGSKTCRVKHCHAHRFAMGVLPDNQDATKREQPNQPLRRAENNAPVHQSESALRSTRGLILNAAESVSATATRDSLRSSVPFEVNTMLSRISSIANRLPRRQALLVLAFLIGAFLVRDWMISTRPWPPTETLLAENATCFLKGRPLTNEESEIAPIEVTAGEKLSIVGEVASWDYPFSRSITPRHATRAVPPRAEDAIVAERLPFLLVTFRQQGWIKNLAAGSYHYDGRSGLEIDNNGETLRFQHKVSAPTEPGRYRVQVHVLERNPTLLAQMDPQQARQPLGVLAEAVMIVQ